MVVPTVEGHGMGFPIYRLEGEDVFFAPVCRSDAVDGRQVMADGLRLVRRDDADFESVLADWVQCTRWYPEDAIIVPAHEWEAVINRG